LSNTREASSRKKASVGKGKKTSRIHLTKKKKVHQLMRGEVFRIEKSNKLMNRRKGKKEGKGKGISEREW